MFKNVVICLSATLSLAHIAHANDDEYKAQLPDAAIYQAMLDANKKSGWVGFRNYDGKQLVYFTALQTMHCRLSEIRYSINSEALDKTFPLGQCNPQLPFNLPQEPEYIYLSLPLNTATTVTVQIVWDNEATSEIAIYKPCDNVGEQTCSQLVSIK